MKKKTALLPVAVAVSALSFVLLMVDVAPVYAQAGQELIGAVTQQMGQSMQALTGYSYQQRTEVQVKGETKSVQLSQVAFGPNRQPMITPLSEEPAEKKEHGLRGRIKEEKAAEMKEEIQQLVQLSNNYLMLSQDKMQQLVRQGQALVSPDSGNVRVEVSGLLQPADHMTMNCDGMMKNRMQVQVQTAAADGSPVAVTALYQTLPTGLNYNAQTVIAVPSKGLQITINTLNYQKQ